MRTIFISTILTLSACTCFAQFQDTTELKNYIIENIRDKRPEKVTADQIQKSLLGLMRQQNVPGAENGIVNDAGIYKIGGSIGGYTTLNGNEYYGGLLLKKFQHFNVDSTNFINLIAPALKLGITNHQGMLLKDDYIDAWAKNSILLNTKSVWLMTPPYFDGQYNGIQLTGYKNNQSEDSVLTTDNNGKLKFTLAKNLGNSNLTVTSNRTISGNHGLMQFDGFGLISLKSFGSKSEIQVSESGSAGMQSFGTGISAKVFASNGNKVIIHAANSGVEVNTSEFRVVKFAGGSQFDTKFSVDYEGRAAFEGPVQFKKSIRYPIRRILGPGPVNITDTDYTVLVGPDDPETEEINVHLPDAIQNEGMIIRIKRIQPPSWEFTGSVQIKIWPSPGQTIEEWENYLQLNSLGSGALLQALGGVWYDIKLSPY